MAAALTCAAAAHAEDLDPSGLSELDRLLAEGKPESLAGPRDQEAERIRVVRAWCVLDYLDRASGDGFALLWRACGDLAEAGAYTVKK